MEANRQAALIGLAALLGPLGARAAADLSVIKTATPELVVENRTIDYRLIVTNAGPDQADGVVLVDELPDLVALVSAESGCVAETPTRLRCSLGNLPANSSRTLQFQVTAPAISDFPPLEEFVTNRARVDTPSPDPVVDNDADEVTVRVVREEDAADLTLDLDDAPDPVDTSAPLRYTLELFNNSAISVETVTTTFRIDGLPLSELVAIDATLGSCVSPLDTCFGTSCQTLLDDPIEVTCNLGNFTATGTERVVVTVTAPSTTGTLTAVAAVESNRADPVLTNNTATAVTTVEEASATLSGLGGTCVFSSVLSGTPWAGDLNHLRRLRDRMRCHRWGERLVAGYYRVTPALTRWLRRHPRAWVIARKALTPVVLLARSVDGSCRSRS